MGKIKKQAKSERSWPAFILLFGSLVYSIVDKDGFYAMAETANTWVLEHFGWTYSLTSFLSCRSCHRILFSPRQCNPGRKRCQADSFQKELGYHYAVYCNGGRRSVLGNPSEPIYHMAAPPAGMEPNTWQSAKFAMETMVLHWSIHPYSLYTLPVIAFAFAFFNMKKPFSVASQLSVITDRLHIKTTENSKFTQILDTILLFAMGLGILGVICTGTLNMGGALRELTGMESRSGAWLIILSIVTVCFIISSISGIQKGIKLLSNINVIIYFAILGVLFIIGPTMFMIDGTVEAVGGTFSQLPPNF